VIKLWSCACSSEEEYQHDTLGVGVS
jgi:hypothetical protein